MKDMQKSGCEGGRLAQKSDKEFKAREVTGLEAHQFSEGQSYA